MNEELTTDLWMKKSSHYEDIAGLYFLTAKDYILLCEQVKLLYMLFEKFTF